MTWMTPTTYRKRFTDAVALLCKGVTPPDSIVIGWLDGSSDDLQHFAADNGPDWSQGIVLLDAARVLASSPAEGVDHEHGEERCPTVSDCRTNAGSV